MFSQVCHFIMKQCDQVALTARTILAGKLKVGSNTNIITKVCVMRPKV